MVSRRLGLGATLLAVALSVVAVPAQALEASSLEVVSVVDRDVELLMTLDPKVAIPTDAAVTGTMEVGGVVFPAQTNLNVKDTRPRAAILVLDASGSMAGARLKAAKAAAQDFVDTLPADVRIGLISFNDSVQVLEDPTTDKAAVLDMVRAVKATGDTTLYDGIAQGLQAAVNLDRPRIVVLSDGADTSSATSLSEVRTLVEDAGVPVDIVGIQPGTDQAAILRQFTGASDGQLLTVGGAGELGSAFVEATKSFGVQVGLRGAIPADLDASGQQITATVSVDGRVSEQSTQLPDVDSLHATATASGSAAVRTQSNVVTPSWWRSLWPIAAGLVVAGSVLLIAYAVRRQRARAAALARVRQVFSYRTGARYAMGGEDDSDVEVGLLGALDALISRFSWYDGMRSAIIASELAFSPAAWLLVRVGVTTILVVLLSIVFGSVVLGVVLGLGLGWFGTWAWLKSRARSRQRHFADELPDFLLLIASSLRAGLSFTHALESSAADGKGEVSVQLRRVVREVQVGADMNDALMDCADRMDNDDLRWVVTALSIQREVGGSLSEILETAAQTIKARYQLLREVRTLSAEGRLSAYILIGLPVAVFLVLLAVRREYISMMWTDPVGILMLVVLGVLMTVGVVWMRSVVRIKV